MCGRLRARGSEDMRKGTNRNFTRLKSETMPIIGVGGSSASGKTSVCRLFQKWGAHIIDADRIGKDVVETNPLLLGKLVEAFGEQILGPSRALDRKKLGRIVFNNPDARWRLNAMVHPPLLAELRNQIRSQQERDPDSIIVVDAALLFEWNLESILDLSVVVEASEERRMERLLEKTELSRDEAQERIKAQAGLAMKNASADLMITNNGSLEDLEHQAREVWEHILCKSQTQKTKSQTNRKTRIPDLGQRK